MVPSRPGRRDQRPIGGGRGRGLGAPRPGRPREGPEPPRTAVPAPDRGAPVTVPGRAAAVPPLAVSSGQRRRFEGAELAGRAARRPFVAPALAPLACECRSGAPPPGFVSRG